MGTTYTAWDTSTGKESFKKLIKNHFDSTARKAVTQSDRLYNMRDSDDLFERDLRTASLPPGAAVPEGGRIPIYSPKFGGTKDYNQATFGLGYRVSWLMKKTNKMGYVKKWNTSLAMRQKELKDVELAKIWNSPTATYTGFDSQVLGYASHTCLDDSVSTFSNIGSAAISVAALENAEYYFDIMKDDQGTTFTTNAKGNLLYFHPSLKFTIMEILRSTGKPHELSNTFNFWEDRFEPFPYVRLTSTTAWGLCAVKNDLYDVNCYTLADPDVDTFNPTDGTRDTVVNSLQAFSYGYGDARMVYIGNV
jgi:hypothetical protein